MSSENWKKLLSCPVKYFGGPLATDNDEFMIIAAKTTHINADGIYNL